MSGTSLTTTLSQNSWASHKQNLTALDFKAIINSQYFLFNFCCWNIQGVCIFRLLPSVIKTGKIAKIWKLLVCGGSSSWALGNQETGGKNHMRKQYRELPLMSSLLLYSLHVIILGINKVKTFYNNPCKWCTVTSTVQRVLLKEVPELSQSIHRGRMLLQISGLLYLFSGSWSIAVLIVSDSNRKDTFSVISVKTQNQSFLIVVETQSFHITLFSVKRTSLLLLFIIVLEQNQ